MSKIKHLFLLMLLSLCSMASYAYDFEVDGLYYNLVSASDRTCELVGCSDQTTHIEIPSSVNSRGIELYVLNMSASSFFRNGNIESISFEKSLITNIPNEAFLGCSKLKTVNLSGKIHSIGAKAFYSCPIEKLTIPSNIETIGLDAFSGVKELLILDSDKQLSISNSIVTIEKAYIGRTLSNTILSNSKISSIELGEKVTSLCSGYFSGCVFLQQVSIPSSVLSIENGAFDGCTSLTNVSFADSENNIYIGSHSSIETSKVHSDKYTPSMYFYYYSTYYDIFYDCPLTNVYLGRELSYPHDKSEREYDSKIEWIRESMGHRYEYHWIRVNNTTSPFAGKNIKVRLGEFVKEIGVYLFANCNFSGGIDLKNCERINADAFKNSNIASLDLKGVCSVGSNSFSGCKSLKGVKGGSNCVLNPNSFSNCEELQFADCSGVESIADNTFSECKKLKWVLLGESVNKIGASAFGGCSNILTIGCQANTPPIAFSSTFENINKWDATLFVKEGTKEKYSTADGWKEFLFVEEMPMPEFVVSTTNAPSDSNPQNHILKQPDNENPIVELANADNKATYQWYRVSTETIPANTPIGLMGQVLSLGEYPWINNGSCIESSNMAKDNSSSCAELLFDFKTGDKLSFDWSVNGEQYFDNLHILENGENIVLKNGVQTGHYENTFENEQECTYQFRYVKDESVSEGDDKAAITNISLVSPEKRDIKKISAIEGENTNYLQTSKLSYGDKVFCIVTLGNGYKLKSNEFVIEELPIPSDTYCLVLEKKNGSLEKYVLSDRPEISISNKTVTVTSEKVQTDCPIVDFVRFYFEENKADEISVNTASSFAFKYNDNMVRISGAEKAEVYSADGMKLMEQGATNGDIRMNISSFVPGLYIIKTDKKSIKIRK